MGGTHYPAKVGFSHLYIDRDRALIFGSSSFFYEYICLGCFFLLKLTARLLNQTQMGVQHLCKNSKLETFAGKG